MAHVNAIDGVRPLCAWGGEPFILSTYFTTGATGVPTMPSAATHGGRVSVNRLDDDSGTPNTYRITFGATWEDTQACHVTHSLAATVNHTLTIDPTTGEVEIAFSTDFDSARADITLIVSASTSR